MSTLNWQKSTYSEYGSSCIYVATRYGWQKSSFSGEGNACLYLAATEAIHLRESDAPNIIITATPRRLRRLISSIKSGALDRPTR